MSVNTILTPITLWKDFDDSLPLDEETLSEREEGGAVVRDLYFYGRQTKTGRVKIYAQYYSPAGKEEFPAVMILFEAGMPFDTAFVLPLIERGYGALCVDYCGDCGGERYTLYPEDIDYANFSRAGRAIEYAEPTARETSWYEWAGVARYAARFLSQRKEVTRFGAIGLRTGGEVLFKVAPYASFSCFVSVCAAGWLAYRGIGKFDDARKVFNEERHHFIAGVDSQSYAPYAKCPVLLISAVNDKKYNYDRTYDTFNQINPDVEKAILFSAHGNGLVGMHSLENLMLFLDRFLKGRTVFISAPIGFSAGEDEEGNFVIKAEFDPAGEIVEYGYFFTEKIAAFKSRDWTCVAGDTEALSDGNKAVMPLSVYTGCKKVLVYVFARYSNGFSVTSKIQEISVGKEYRNSVPRTRAIYSSEEGLNGFTGLRSRLESVADCFAAGGRDVWLAAGYGGIKGITSRSGIVSYRVSEPRYAAPEGASFAFDVYCKEDARLSVSFFINEDEEAGYSVSVKVAGGGKWKRIVLEEEDFKAETGAPFKDFSLAVSVLFYSEQEVLVNNVAWL